MTNPSTSQSRIELRNQIWQWFPMHKDHCYWPDVCSDCNGRLDEVMALIDSYTQELVAEAKAGLIERVANPDFVYEVMNAPTNGTAVDWVKAQLSVPKEDT